MAQPVDVIPRLTPARRPPVASILLRWFARHRRDLPWRRSDGGPREPYHVWLAEVMLQQTQVGTVVPYYRRWLERFPTLKDLAEAPLDDVLKLWEGLGYYSRARNFHRAAQAVMRDHAGRIPDTVEALLALPGVGRYTAGAIASLAFGRDAPVLDGNVRRVLCRLFALEGGIGRDRARLETDLWRLSESLLPKGRAGEFNEALMDLGATVCTPRAPSCSVCPLATSCRAYANGNPEAYPTRRARPPLPHKSILTAVVCAPDGALLLAQRPAEGLLGGLWEFPGDEVEETAMLSVKKMAAQLRRILRGATGLRVPVKPGDFAGQVRHAFTHFRITRHVAVVRLGVGDWRSEIGDGDWARGLDTRRCAGSCPTR